jgi:hypothetical protein
MLPKPEPTFADTTSTQWRLLAQKALNQALELLADNDLSTAQNAAQFASTALWCASRARLRDTKNAQTDEPRHG